MDDRQSEGVRNQPPSLESWYREYWSPLVRSAWLMCGSRELAEDLVHDAFVRLHRSGALPDRPLSYLRRIVVNLLADASRRDRLARAAAAEAPAIAVEPAEMETWQLVNGLPMRQRQALVLRYADDLSLEEIAENMNCSQAAVKSLIHRGLEALREEMGKSAEY